MKKINKKRLLSLHTVLLMVLFAPLSIAFAETTLKIATWLPKEHVMNDKVLSEWASWIEEDTKGEVKIVFEYPKTHPKNMLGLVESGEYDGAWTYNGYFPDKFKLTQIVELPLNGVGPEAASVAHWRIHNKHFKNADEYQGLQLIGTFTHGEAQLHTKEPITNLEELRGKKVRIPSAVGAPATIAKRLGLEGVIASPNKIYQMLKDDEISVVFMPLVEKKALKLKEVAPYTYKFRGGLYLGSFGIFMNPQSVSKLSEENRTIITKHSGEKLSRFAGISWGNEDMEGEKDAIRYGNDIKDATATMRDDLERLLLDADNLWVDEINSLGMDGTKILDEYRQLSRCGSITSRI